MAKITDLTKGNITRVILAFFFPMLMTNLLQQIYTVADTAIVGQGLGDDKLAAVGNMASLTFLIFGFATGLANGFSIIIAQHFGAKDFSALRKSIAATIQLFIVFSIILTIGSMAALPALLNLIQTEAEIFADSLKYGYCIFAGLSVTLTYNISSAMLRALGDSKTPFYAILTSSVINITLDTVCILLLHTGVEGAALATVFSQVIASAICIKKLWSISEIRFSRDDFQSCGTMCIPLVLNGLPMALMNSITAIGSVVLQYFVNGFGVAYTSSYSVSGRYINLFMQPACTAGFTMSAFTSQNYGAKEYERIRSGLKVCLSIALVSYVTLGTVMMFFPRQLALLMVKGEDALTLTEHYLPICGFMLFAVDFLFVFRSGVQSMGHPTIPMISGILEMVLRVVVVFLLIDQYGFNSTAYAQTAAWFCAFLMNGLAFQYYLHQKLTLKCAVTTA
ncbi:MAG: MATE family efflux transporter [Oscillospiraceae bacterium]|nr:MATE family efflux transporter [Oscillospiraceae bacterium]